MSLFEFQFVCSFLLCEIFFGNSIIGRNPRVLIRSRAIFILQWLFDFYTMIIRRWNFGGEWRRAREKAFIIGICTRVIFNSISFRDFRIKVPTALLYILFFFWVLFEFRFFIFSLSRHWQITREAREEVREFEYTKKSPRQNRWSARNTNQNDFHFHHIKSSPKIFFYCVVSKLLWELECDVTREPRRSDEKIKQLEITGHGKVKPATQRY